MKVYVAGSSAQLDRVEHVIAQLEDRGYTITHNWVEEVRAVGSANPLDASESDRKRWAQADLKGVYDADVLFLLMPSTEGWGAGVELGFAFGISCPVVVSGGCTERSIFTSLATCYDRDDLAIEAEFPVLEPCDCSACVDFRKETN